MLNEDMDRRKQEALSKAIDDIAIDIHETKIANGWQVTTPVHWAESNHIPANLALVHSEVSEALEAFRKNDFEGFAEELADVAIRVIGLSHGLGIDLGDGIVRKVGKNRFRSYKHGGKKL